MKVFVPKLNLIPEIEEIIELTQKESLTLEFPNEEITTSSESNLISDLKNNLPENYSIFKSGTWHQTTSFTIKPIIKNETIKQNIKFIENAIIDYIDISKKLVLKNNAFKNYTQNWKIVEIHGEHTRYKHKETGQILETSNHLITELKYIDPYFLGLFITTSKKHVDLKKVIRDNYHDTTKILAFIKNEQRVVEKFNKTINS